jgi:hypothetical protein
MLTVHSEGVCFDDPFTVRLSGFEGHSARVEAVLWDDEKRREFRSHVDVPLVQGRGDVADGALLLLRLCPAKPGDRYAKTDLTTPCVVTLSCGSATTRVERYILRPGDARQSVDVEWGGFRIFATLFVPAGPPTPAIVEIGGSAGGLMEGRSALICSKTRRPTLALAWYRYKSLPETMCVPVEYVIAAAEWLLAQPCVARGSRVSIYTISKGAELSFLAAAHSDLFDRILAVGMQCFLTEPSFTIGGKMLPHFLEMDVEKIEWIEAEGAYNLLHGYDVDPETRLDAVLPCKFRSVTDVLLVCGSDDQNLLTHRSSLFLASRLAPTCNVEVVSFVGGGHLLEPPSPHCDKTVTALLGGALMMFGGTNVELHAHARRRAWSRLLEFFAMEAKARSKL